MSEAQTTAYVFGVTIDDVLRLGDATCLTSLRFVNSPPLVELHAWFPEDSFFILLEELSGIGAVWQTGYHSKGIYYASNVLRLNGEKVYQEFDHTEPSGEVGVYFDGETKSCAFDDVTEDVREHAAQAFHKLTALLGKASIVLPPSFGEHLGKSIGRHTLEHLSWTDASASIPFGPQYLPDDDGDIPF